MTLKEVISHSGNWAIRIGDCDELEIEYSGYPITGKVALNNMTISELKALAQMFSDMATELEKDQGYEID